MNEGELNILYGQIKLMEVKKSSSVTGKKAASIERIREMTSSSKSNWSKAVISEREDRR